MSKLKQLELLPFFVGQIEASAKKVSEFLQPQIFGILGAWLSDKLMYPDIFPKFPPPPPPALVITTVRATANFRRLNDFITIESKLKQLELLPFSVGQIEASAKKVSEFLQP